METNEIASFVLLIVTVGLLIGVGVIVADKFGSINSYDRTNSNRSITFSNQTVTLGVGNITSVHSVVNASDYITYPSACYTIDNTNGSINLRNTNNATCGTYPSKVLAVLVDYKDYNTATSSAMASVSSEIAGIGSNWIGLIIVISMLSIIITLVVRSFGFGGVGRR